MLNRTENTPHARPVYRTAAACIFCGLLFALFALQFLPDRSFSETEKRTLAQFPKVSVETLSNGKAEKELETYVQDQMPLRNFWVGVCAYFSRAAGQNGTVGEDGRGTYAAAEGYLIDVPVKENPRNLGSNLRTLTGFVQKAGVPAYLMVVPQTGYVLDNKLPKRHAAYTDDAIFGEIAQKTDGVYTMVDLREVFRAQRDAQQIYYRTDHHWTSDGAFLAANAFLQAAGKPALDRARFAVETVDGFYGTTYSRAGLWRRPADAMELWTVKDASLHVEITDLGKAETTRQNDVFFRGHLTEYDRYPVYLDGNHSLTHIVNDAVPDGVLLLIKDSFGNTLATELAAAYHEIWMVDLRYYRTEAVSELLEKGVDTLLVNYSLDDMVNDRNMLWLK